MLHDVIFALSGHGSPLFDHGEEFPDLESSERVLLASLSRLGAINRALQSHLSKICSSELSAACRAVATTLRNHHLAKFQQAIVEFEQQLLLSDSQLVGAYTIVPLVNVVGKFNGYKRILNWYWDLACFISSVDHSDALNEPHSCTSAGIINRLRDYAQTGYPDIEEAALELLVVAEKCWMRQLCSWLLASKLPNSVQTHDQDFFIQRKAANINSQIDWSLVPAFLNEYSASSVLFVCRTHELLHFSARSRKDGAPRVDNAVHGKPSLIRELQTLTYPLSSPQLSATINEIRRRVSREVFNNILSADGLIKIADYLRLLLLGGREDFSACLIREADKHLLDRHRQINGSIGAQPANLAGVTLTNMELNSILGRTWVALAPHIGRNETVDGCLDWARDCLRLQISENLSDREHSPEQQKAGVVTSEIKDVFDNFLVSTPATLNIYFDSALELFMSRSQLELYSTISNYLFAIRRGHIHLTGLWRDSSLRRYTPAPPGPRLVNQRYGNERARKARKSITGRMDALRRAWSSCCIAISVLVELGDFFASEIIPQSWQAFKTWVLKSASDTPPRDTASIRPNSSSSFLTHSFHSSADSSFRGTGPLESFEDPEVISNAHTQYINTLADSLFLNEASYVESLRTLLQRIDKIVAFLQRLRNVQRNLDLEQEGVELEVGSNLYQDEQDLYSEIKSSAHNVDKAITQLIQSLRDSNNAPPRVLHSHESGTDFKPWTKANSLDQLLMRLDIGLMNHHE